MGRVGVGCVGGSGASGGSAGGLEATVRDLEARVGDQAAGGAEGCGGWLLALHSSSDQLGVGVLPWPDPHPQTPSRTMGASGGLPTTALSGNASTVVSGNASAVLSGNASTAQQAPTKASAAVQTGDGAQVLIGARLQAFATGRDLANQLLTCLESLLPAHEWPRLRRLAVATGPGGFTSTRLTVVLARTLAQQGDLPLDGVSSYQLIARRLWRAQPQPTAPFWLVQDLPRRGRVAGLYGPDPAQPGELIELEAPRLQDPQRRLEGAVLPAEPRLPEDVAELLAISRGAAARGLAAPWNTVVPLYPTGPVPQRPPT